MGRAASSLPTVTPLSPTAKMGPNPHRSHLGDVNCVECHSGHAQPRLMCNDCHRFSIMPK